MYVKVIFIGKKDSGKQATLPKFLEDVETHSGFFDGLDLIASSTSTKGSAIVIKEYELPFDNIPCCLVEFYEKAIDERDAEKILGDVSLMLQAGVVHFNSTAKQLGLYKTELEFDQRIIYVCDTGDQELDQKLKALFEQYYREYAQAPYAVFSYGDEVGRAEEAMRTIPHAKKVIDAKYKINGDFISKKIERAGYLMLTKNMLFGSLILAAVDLMAAELPKT